MLEQLKAKEQECEELKIYIESNEQQVKEVETLVMDNDRLINELDQLKFDYAELEKRHNDSFEQFKQLKAENEELKKKVESYLCSTNCYKYQQTEKLKQTLAEIKPILEYYANSTIGEEQEDGTYRIELSYKYGSSNMYGAPCYYKYNPKPAKQALQKISEVLE